MHYYLQVAEPLPHEIVAMPLESWKSIFEMAYYAFASGAVIGAYLTYRKNSRLEQARWASTFYEKFYETDRYKKVRDILDCPADLTEVNQLVNEEASEFTDYLNFFEHIVIFTEAKQLNGQDVEDSFGYYFNCLDKLETMRIKRRIQARRINNLQSAFAQKLAGLFHKSFVFNRREFLLLIRINSARLHQ